MGRGPNMDASTSRPDRGLDVSADLRCAVLTRQTGETCAGSAPQADLFVLVELPEPWPAEILRHPLLGPVRSLTPSQELGVIRWLGVRTPQPRAQPDDELTVVAWSRTPGNTHLEYTGRESRVTADDLATVLSSLLAEGPSVLSRPITDRADVLICGHQARDVCCGDFGERTARDLAELDQGDPTATARRVWLTSHLGGHRFAPTGLTFPSGLCWARLEAEELVTLISSGDPTPFLAHLRGFAAFPPAAQVADLAMAREVDGWFQTTRTLSDSPAGHSSESGHSVIRATSGGRCYDVELSAHGRVPVPACGLPISAAKKSATPLMVDAVRPVDNPD